MTRALRGALILIPVLYLAVCAALWPFQERMLFPTWLAGASGPLPAGGERLTLTAPDGVELHGVYLPPARADGGDTLLLSFAGNATNAQALAERLRVAFPEHPIAAFHYRGYAPSGGTPGAETMVADAPLAYDLVASRYRPRRIVAIGVSLGSGIAASLAAARPLAGVILVTPFDSLKNVAQQVYWWVPVSLLMRHDVDAAAALSGREVPVAIVAAADDGLVRPERTAKLREVLSDLRHDAILPGADHNDIFSHPDFDEALRRSLASLNR
jgi:uncharacterized protein